MNKQHPEAPILLRSWFPRYFDLFVVKVNRVGFFYNKFIFIYLWLHWVFVAAHGLFSSCSELELLFVVVRGLFIVVASLVAEHRL